MSAELIKCGGYFSCAFDTTITNTYLSENYNYSLRIDCDGSYSCYKSSSIIINGEHPDLNCNGLMSCAYISYISVLDYIYCNGEQSCIGSNINYGSSLYCDGFQSCKDVNAKVRSNIDDSYYYTSVILYGMLSGQNSIFYANSDSSYNYFDFYGAYSGVNATVVCVPNIECAIYCYGTEACNHNFTILCDTTGYDSSEECDINVYCSTYDDHWSSNTQCWDKDTGVFNGQNQIINVWNNGKYYEIPEFPLLWDISTGQVTFESSTLSNSIDICGLDGMNADIDSFNINETKYDSDSIICADYEECKNIEVASGEGGNICCLGGKSCYNSTSIIAGNNGIIRCDGGLSCARFYDYYTYAYNDVTLIDGRNGDNMYFTGYQALYSGYDDDYGRNITGNGNNDIFCLGSQSCYHVPEISNIRNIYLMGDSGSNAMVNQVNGNVYAYAYNAGADASNVKGNVYCAGENSCSSYMEDINGDIFCYGRHTCSSVRIDGTVNGSIYAIGSYSMAYSDIYARIETIIVTGEDALYYTTITNTKNVIANGDYTLGGYRAEIFSSDYWKELYVSVNGSNNNDFEVTCYYGHSCTILCPDKCDVVLNCQGNCTLVGVKKVKRHSYHNNRWRDGWTGAEIAGAVISTIIIVGLICFCAYKTNKNSAPQVVMNQTVVAMVPVNQFGPVGVDGNVTGMPNQTGGVVMVPVTQVQQQPKPKPEERDGVPDDDIEYENDNQ